MRVIEAEKVLTDEQSEALIGTHIDETYIKHFIEEDCDVYYQGTLLLKFRKKIVSDELLLQGWKSFHKLAKHSRGRGASAGPIDPDSTYWSKRTPYNISKKGYSTYYLKPDGTPGKMIVNNLVASNPIGYYESTKSLGLNLPCRLSYYTEKNLGLFQAGMPYLKEFAKSYKDLNPDEYQRQNDRADERPNLRIPGTPFSTITINRNFRTACHKDKGDFGFGNLSVLERGSYQGGFFVFPQFGVGVDMRAGDHLCADVHQIHGNTPIFETHEDKIYNSLLPDIYRDNPDVGCKGLDKGEKYSRISLVMYLREKILIKCPLQKNKYYINLDKDMSRNAFWEDTDFHRFSATHYDDMDPHDPLFQKMVSYWNVPEKQHKAKCGCFMSHLRMLEQIVDKKEDKVIICEDDAEKVNNIPDDLPEDCISYLGGFITHRKISSKAKLSLKSKPGINKVKDDQRMVMLLAYYIPKWEMARDILDYLTERFIAGRVRAIDIEIFNALAAFSVGPAYVYPAPFIERDVPSNIRENKQKHSNELYEWR